MAPLRYAAKFDPFLSLDCAPTLHPGAIQGKEGIKFCDLATLPRDPLLHDQVVAALVEILDPGDQGSNSIGKNLA